MTITIELSRSFVFQFKSLIRICIYGPLQANDMWPCLSATLVATCTSSAFSAKLLKKVEILELIGSVVLNQGFFNGAKEEAWAFVMFTTG